MKGYWIAKYRTIENKDKLGSYAELAIQAIKDFGGTALVRGGKYKTLEGDEFIRTVIWEFKDYNTAINCYNSEKYQKAWSRAKETTIRDLLIVEGV
ncbi:MAG: DUF1330 domain-containing protein [Candidatus Fonsibacter sp.]|jgi:uncharacterized protein (DUF1330 family)|nr:DUF1330 domain-containing protein [Pelagibacterales bacterium]